MEKSFTQSKKFIFATIGIGVLAILGIISLLTQAVGIALSTVLIVIIIVIGFIVVGVVLGQTVLDKYVRVASLFSTKKQLSKSKELENNIKE